MSESSESSVVIGSEIAEYYKNKSIFITGATGFIGKVLIEKLLRSCSELKAIYILIRSKRGQNIQERLNEMFNNELFANITQFNPEVIRQKVIPINGDLLEPNLGISQQDQELLCREINIVMHSAATVRFDEPLKLAVDMNIIGVKKMIDLARRMKKLEVFVHVSTAYANCDKQHISEVVYNPPIQPEKLLEAVDWMEEDLIKLLTPNIIQFRPNTYTYTKAIAENLVIDAEREIPFTIVRPSIVGASWREPFPGWIDNYNGPTALFIASGKGVLRVMLGNKNAIADIIPVDIPVNTIIAAAWLKATKQQSDPSQTVVYNCTTGQINPLRWGVVAKTSFSSITKNPFENVFLYPNPHFTSSKFIKNIRLFLEQVMPSYLMDCYFRLMHKKPIFMRIQSKLDKAVGSLEFFTTHQWEWTNDNMFMLQSKMNSFDSRIFNLNCKEIHWPSYIETYCIGAKKYVLKEDLSKMPLARKKLASLKRTQDLIKLALLIVLVKFLLLRKYSIKSLFLFVYRLAIKLASKLNLF